MTGIKATSAISPPKISPVGTEFLTRRFLLLRQRELKARKMRRLPLALLAASIALPAHADDWPASVFMPGLSWDSRTQGLCKSFERKVRAEYFINHPQRAAYASAFKPPSRYVDETSDELKRGESEIFNFRNPEGRYFGDIDGDSSHEEIFVQSYFSSNVEGNRIFLGLTKLSPRDVEMIRGEWNEMIETETADISESKKRNFSLFRKRKYIPYSVVVKYGVSTGRIGVSKYFETAPRDLPIQDEQKEIAATAFRYRTPFQFIEYDDRLYGDTLVEARWQIPRRYDYLSTKSSRVLLSFDQNMRPKAECIVTASPDRRILKPAILEAPSAAKLLNNVIGIEGVEGKCAGGSLDPWSRHKREREFILLNVLTRPWRLGTGDAYKTGPFFAARNRQHAQRQWLRVWRLLSVSNIVEYDRLISSRDEAWELLAGYYENEFNAHSKLASEWADNALEAILASASLGSTDAFGKYKAELDRIERGDADADDFLAIAFYDSESRRRPSDPERVQQSLDRAFRYAVAASANKQTLQELLNDGARVDSGNESALMLSVRDRKMVKFLLNKGADPNRPNVFGKTPLMMAAHIEQTDTAALLLKNGADPNLQTLGSGTLMARDTEQWRSSNYCDYNIKFGNRTALMYAAENSSPKFVELLLDANADPTAKDSNQRDIRDYLDRNGRLDEKQKERVRKLLGKQADADWKN
ncbi:MAG: ankyrin repeat domain-containing protein [Pseudomonadota bacterium]